MLQEDQTKDASQEKIKTKATIWRKIIIMLSIIIFIVTIYIFYYALTHGEYLLSILAILILLLSNISIDHIPYVLKQICSYSE